MDWLGHQITRKCSSLTPQNARFMSSITTWNQETSVCFLMKTSVSFTSCTVTANKIIIFLCYTAGNQKCFVNLKNNSDFDEKEIPDGMTIDGDNNLWIALFFGGRLVKIDPISGIGF